MPAWLSVFVIILLGVLFGLVAVMILDFLENLFEIG